MSDTPSDAYVIDEDYTIVSFNDTITGLCPQLEVGEKCHRRLMGLDEPCPPCPVANHVFGPRTDDELHKLLEQKYYDSVTGGYSRQGFIREVERVFAEGDRSAYAVVVFDIFNFKAINDALGVEGGDEALSIVFDALKDSSMQPVVSARLESDWFAFLTRRELVEQGSFASLLNMEWNRDGRKFTVHLRCGICCVNDDALPVSKVIERAIIAKTCAGVGGMSMGSVSEESMLKSYISHADITARFRNSLERGDFKVYYQPIVRAEDGAVCSAEALVRWEHPTMGTIAPRGRSCPCSNGTIRYRCSTATSCARCTRSKSRSCNGARASCRYR
ncbi:MAG: diguanylate cyclase [Coriobacteriales bacterium]|nr:diguanylate cyclase [Coriobacteriales bacterium]